MRLYICSRLVNFALPSGPSQNRLLVSDHQAWITLSSTAWTSSLGAGSLVSAAGGWMMARSWIGHVGDSVTVIAGTHHVGKTGTLTDVQGDFFVVEFRGDAAQYAFKSEDLKLQPATNAPSASNPSAVGLNRNRPRMPRWVWKGGIAVLVGLIVIAGATWVGFQIYDSKRWSDYPHTAACVISYDPETASLLGAQNPPPAARVKQATLAHAGGQRLRISIEFADAPPPLPRSVVSPYTGQQMDAPGSLSYMVLLHRPPADEGSIQILSSRTGQPWMAGQMEYIVMDMIDEPVPTGWDPHRNLLEAVETSGNTVHLLLDLDGVPELFGHGPFRPSIRVIAERQGVPTREFPDGEPTPFLSQDCSWGATSAAYSGDADRRESLPTRTRSSVAPALPTQTRSSVVPVPPAVDSSPPRSENAMRWRFQSPTGNIACDLDGTSGKGIASCEVRNHTYKPVREGCDRSKTDRFTLSQGVAVQHWCYPGTDYGSGLPVQQYGRPLTVGSITCVLDEATGVTCTDATTNHFFQAARQAYQWR